MSKKTAAPIQHTAWQTKKHTASLQDSQQKQIAFGVLVYPYQFSVPFFVEKKTMHVVNSALGSLGSTKKEEDKKPQ